MAKLKTALLRAQETADIIGANEALLWRARNALSEALENPAAPAAPRCAEHALHLLNAYLLETELCK